MNWQLRRCRVSTPSSAPRQDRARPEWLCTLCVSTCWLHTKVCNIVHSVGMVQRREGKLKPYKSGGGGEPAWYILIFSALFFMQLKALVCSMCFIVLVGKFTWDLTLPLWIASFDYQVDNSLLNGWMLTELCHSCRYVSDLLMFTRFLVGPLSSSLVRE